MEVTVLMPPPVIPDGSGPVKRHKTCSHKEHVNAREQRCLITQLKSLSNSTLNNCGKVIKDQCLEGDTTSFESVKQKGIKRLICWNVNELHTRTLDRYTKSFGSSLFFTPPLF